MSLNFKYLLLLLLIATSFHCVAQNDYSLKIPVKKILENAQKQNAGLDTSLRNNSGTALFNKVNAVYHGYPDAAPSGMSAQNYHIDVPTQIIPLIIKNTGKGQADTTMGDAVNIGEEQQIAIKIPSVAINNSAYSISYKVSGLSYKSKNEQTLYGNSYSAQSSPVSFTNKVDIEDKPLSIFISSFPERAAVFYIDIYNWNVLKHNDHFVLAKLFNPLQAVKLNGRADFQEILSELAKLPGNSAGIGTNTSIPACNRNYIIFVLWGSPNQTGDEVMLLGKKYLAKTFGQNIICFDRTNITCKN
jgi:hypothetical protein